MVDRRFRMECKHKYQGTQSQQCGVPQRVVSHDSKIHGGKQPSCLILYMLDPPMGARVAQKVALAHHTPWKADRQP
jgi:hypothetical protein